jgi:galactokinase
LKFDRRPGWIAIAPGRVNLIGEHVDYNDGFVLPMAIEKYVVIAGAPHTDAAGLTNIVSLCFQTSHTFDLAAPLLRETRDWHDLVRGVIENCKKSDLEVAPFDAVIASDIPVGSGLSSSAAVEVAVATLIEAMSGRQLLPAKKALLCQQAEHEFAGVPCGIMDQFSSVFGRRDHLMLLDCRNQQLEFIPFANSNVTVLIVNSAVQHRLAGGEYARRRSQCEEACHALGVDSLRDATLKDLNGCQRLDSTLYKRAKHVITEIARTKQAAEAIREGDWSRAGELMYQSHASMRDDFEISCPEVDLLVEIAGKLGEPAGVYGSRMTGGGFGGCTVSLVESDRVSKVANEIAAQYRDATGIEATAFSSRPAKGAHSFEVVPETKLR